MIQTMLSCAIEDDAVWVTDVDFGFHDDAFHVIRASEPRQLCARQFDPRNSRDDQHTIDMEDIIKRLGNAIKALDRPVHYAGLSTFGNVQIETGNIFFRPLEWGGRRRGFARPNASKR